MMIPYFEAAPPYAPNAVEFPEDESEAKESWVRWPLSRDIRRTPLRTHLGATVFPVAIHRAGTQLWLLETQDQPDPRAVISNPDDLWFVLERERAKGLPNYFHFQLAEQNAVLYILRSGYPLPDDISLPLTSAPTPPAIASPTATPPAGSDVPARPGPTVGPSEGDPDTVDGEVPSRAGTRDDPSAGTVSMAPPGARRIPKKVAIKRLMDGIDAFERLQLWGESKMDLHEKSGVPWSSTKTYFRKDQGLQNRWKDYLRKSMRER